MAHWKATMVFCGHSRLLPRWPKRRGCSWERNGRIGTSVGNREARAL